MNLPHNTPNVVHARRGRKSEELAGVAVTGRTGLEHDPNTEFTYAIESSHRIAHDPEIAAWAPRSRPPNKKDQGDLRPWTLQLSFSRHSQESG